MDSWTHYLVWPTVLKEAVQLAILVQLLLTIYYIRPLLKLLYPPSAGECRLAVENALRYFPPSTHAELAEEFAQELREYGHIYMYRYIYTFTGAYTHLQVQIYTYRYIYTCIGTYIHLKYHIYIYRYIYTHVQVHFYIFTGI